MDKTALYIGVFLLGLLMMISAIEGNSGDMLCVLFSPAHITTAPKPPVDNPFQDANIGDQNPIGLPPPNQNLPPGGFPFPGTLPPSFP